MARTRIQAQRQREYHVPAPIGGINSVSAGTDMPATDSIQSYNLIGAEYGLRSRLGWREWCTNLGGTQVRSILPFTGSTKDGANNRLFACTELGIWDVSSSSAVPTMVVTFATQDTDSGYGCSTVFVTLAGHFLIYCDESNGYYVYSEANTTWVKVAQAASTDWAATAAYIVNDRVTHHGVSYICTTGGTSGADGPTGSSAGISDGTVVWDYSPAVGGIDPGKFVSVTAWKNRLWFVERDTGNAWYLPLSAIYGTAVRFQFGNRFKAGGDLRGLWSWTYDGGSGIDDALVAISGAGDVLVYRGTDPSEAGAFALVGVWFVGAVPLGRRLCTDYGGDLLIMSTIGVLPLSTLVTGKPSADRAQYRTSKIANLFNQAQIDTSTVRGWAMRLHPQDACLMVLAPPGQNQFVMSLSTQGWHQYRDFPMGICAEPWNGEFYFGTEDGRVCVNTGYLDAVVLIRTWEAGVAYNVDEWVRNGGDTYRCTTAGTSGDTGPTGNGTGIVDGTCEWSYDTAYYAAINWSLLTSFTNLGTIRHKRVHSIRIRTLSKGESTPVLAEARYGFSFDEIAGSPSGVNTSGSAWDTATWDTAIWSGDYSPSVRVFGANGIGAEVAIAVKGTSSARTTLVAIDVMFDTGGVL